MLPSDTVSQQFYGGSNRGSSQGSPSEGPSRRLRQKVYAVPNEVPETIRIELEGRVPTGGLVLVMQNGVGLTPGADFRVGHGSYASEVILTSEAPEASPGDVYIVIAEEG